MQHPPPAVTSPSHAGEPDWQRVLRETAAARRKDAGEQKKAHYSPNGGEHKQPLSPPAEPVYPAISRPPQQQQQQPQKPNSPAQTSPSPPQLSLSAALSRPPPSHSSSVSPAPAASPAPSSTVHGRARQQPGLALEMPMMWDRDAELAKKLQAEENARAGQNRHSQEDIERRRREQEDERLAREMAERMAESDRRRASEAEEADARLARELAEREEAEERRRAEEAKASALLAEQERIRLENLDRDAELARVLQLEEESQQGHAGEARPAQRRSSSASLSDEGEVLIGPGGEEEEDSSALDAMHRRHADANRLRQLQNSMDLLTTHDDSRPSASLSRSSSSSSSGSHSHTRTREQLIRRLHQLQGSYPAEDRRSATFRFLPDGRMVVLYDDDDADSPDNRSAIAAAATDGVDDVPSPTEREAAEQRAMLEAYERQHRQQQQQHQHQQRQGPQQQAAASSGGQGLFGALGTMFHRAMVNRQHGVPFPLSMILDPAHLHSSSSASSPFVLRSSGGRGSAAELDVDRMSYEELLRLEDMLGSVRPKVKAAKEEELQQLPTRTFHKAASSAAAASKPSAPSSSTSSSSASATSEPSCSICLCDFEEGDEIKTLPCFHAFHAHEIDKWLLTNERCPVCRVGITENPPN